MIMCYCLGSCCLCRSQDDVPVEYTDLNGNAFHGACLFHHYVMELKDLPSSPVSVKSNSHLIYSMYYDMICHGLHI